LELADVIASERGTTESDRSLVRACLQGDRAAWESLIRRYRRLIYSVPIKCGLSTEEAEDVFQTVAIRLFENLERLRQEDRIAAWLATTASRESWRVKKKADRSLNVTQLESLDEAEARWDPEDPNSRVSAETLIRFEEEQTVRRAVDELNERCRTLLSLLFFADPSPPYCEVATRLEMPEGSIGPTRARCLQSLKRILQRLGF
jgi:RNA polymerase sigma factor (sigma-70 family)